MLTPQEWKSIKDKLIKASPKISLILAVLILGYSTGWHMKGSDVVMDCKYANAFRYYTDAFTCQRKI
jgi:hypothetical protein